MSCWKVQPEELRFPEGEEEDTTVIMFTSGTTSVPKGVQLTHDSFASYLLSTVEPADPEVEEDQPADGAAVPYRRVAGGAGGRIWGPYPGDYAAV